MADTPASQPTDSDWNQVHETVMMLNLAVARIETAMCDGNDSIEALGDSFTAIANSVEKIKTTAAAQLEESPTKSYVLENCNHAAQKIQTAIIAFQFYDKLSQRLGHVSKSLGALTKLVGEPSRIHNPDEWRALQQKILACYTLDTDRAMYEAILGGTSLKDIQATISPPQDNDDIELF